MNPGMLAEVFSPAVPTLQQAIEVAGDPAATSEERLEAANAFAETLADLWPSLEAEGASVVELLGLLDMAVSGLPARAELGDAAASVAVIELLALLEAHFETPDDAEVIEALVEIATSEAFESPLSPQGAALWLARLEARDDAPSPSAETEIEETLGTSLWPDTDTQTDAAEALQDTAIRASEPTAAAAETDASLELSDEASELLAILATAVEDSQPELFQRIEEIAAAPEASVRANAALAIQEILVCLADAASQAGFLAFSTVCAGLGYQIAAMPSEHPWPEPLLKRLKQCPRRIQAYLFEPLADSTRLELVEILCDSLWLEPLSAQNAKALLTQLYRDPQTLEVEQGPTRPSEIHPEDLSLAPADDIDGSVMASFCREGSDLAHKLTNVLRTIIEGAGGEAALRQAQRFAHTLKGSANVAGVRAVAVLAHHMEDLLEFLIEQGLTPGAALGDALAAGADGLALMLDILNGVERHDPDSLRPVMQEILDWANRVDREGAAALGATDLEASTGTAPHEVGSDSQTSAAPLADLDAEEAYLQVPARTVDDLLRLVSELSMALSQSEETLSRAQQALHESAELERRNLLQIAELEKLVDLRGLGSRGIVPAHGDATLHDTFDPLELEQYNEMYTATRRLNEGVNDARELSQNLDGALRNLSELTSQQIKLSQRLRHLTLSTRLVPASSVQTRLQRAVRQTCRATGKEAELRLQGGDVQIDGELLDRLLPSMMHILRNAIDHGIEPPETRAAAGKPRQGRIELSFRQVGDRIEVVISDDGRGLDLERVRAKGVARGLIEADATPSDQELALLTLHPGFSTRDQVTQVSGRGVGMDVVASAVRALNGTLAIESQPGLGYRLSARLPASLLAIYCLLVRAGEQLLAIPANEITLAVLAEEGDVRESVDGWSFQHEGETYPLIHLNRLMGLSSEAQLQGRRVVLMMQTDVGARAIMIDALLDGRELMVMKLGSLVPRIPGLMSASILGDGQVVPIVELRTLMRVASAAERGERPSETTAERALPPTVLIVDDSISMRRILSGLVEDAGYQPLTARDGMEAVQQLSQNQVHLLLVDMEMPQMNGLELTAHLRAQPETNALPIAMITSRSTEKHRREALRAGVDAYFVKPYRDDALLDFIQQALEQVT